VLAISLAVLALFCPADARGQTGGPNELRIGLARVCITPEKPLWLHGYANQPRFRPFEGKLNDLYAKAMVIEDARGERAVLITVDLCVLRAAEAEALFGRLTQRTGLARRQLLVNLSHTHSGPMIGASDFSRVPMPAEDQQATLAYTARLYEQIADVALAALADLKPATLAWGSGKCGFVRNRRLYHADGTYSGMGPNADKFVDDAVPVLRVSAPDGTVRGIVFGCACHPVTFGPENLKLSGDYASFAQEAIESSHPGVQAMFVQGCGADANSDPRCGPDAEKHARLQGQSLAAEVGRIVRGPLEPVRGPLQVKFREVALPLKPVPGRAELEKMSGTLAHNAKRMLAAVDRGQPLPSHHSHPLALWQFGRDLIFVGLSGEVVSGYVPLVRAALGAGRLWIAGYCNEVDGYLPDSTIVAEGGYEARGLVADIGFYAAEAEQTLVKAIRDLQYPDQAFVTAGTLPAAEFRNVTCEGSYPHHLQGVCVDEAAIFWSFTTTLVKTDLDGKLLRKVPVANHHGDLCFHDGKLYVAVNLGKFNDPQGHADSWVYVYDAGDLSGVATHETQEVFHGAGGIGFRDGRFFVVGGLPDGAEENYVYEYDAGFRFAKKHVIPSGHTHLGIQTATFANGRWWFGCYGDPKILLVTDVDFNLKGRYEFDCSLGIVGLADGRFLSAVGRSEKTQGCTGSVKLATPDEKSGFEFVP
jgi:hypothetical protein